MRSSIYRVLAILLLSLSALTLYGQKIAVSGIVNGNTGVEKNPLENVRIYSYPTYEKATKKKAELEKIYNKGESIETFNSDTGDEAMTNEKGEFQVLAYEKGAILFMTDSEGVFNGQIEAVKGRSFLQVDIKLTSFILEDAVIRKRKNPRAEFKDEAPEDEGGMIQWKGHFAFPVDINPSSNYRVVLQSFAISQTANPDTVFFNPIVIDGYEYHQTQLRRKDFSQDEDKLMQFVRKDTTDISQPEFLSLKDTLIIYSVNWDKRDYKDRYVAYTDTWVEDYNGKVVLNKRSKVGDTGKTYKKWRLLEYALGRFSVDPYAPDNFVQKKIESIQDEDKLSLEFLVKQAVLDPDDSVSMAALAHMKEKLDGIIKDPDATLEYYQISGTASPEGGYAMNMNLAQRRLEYLDNEIEPIIRSKKNEIVRGKPTPSIVPWSVVADTVEARGMPEQAAAMRKIIEKYPGDKNTEQQGRIIKDIPGYRNDIYPLLKLFRTVTFTLTYHVNRLLEPEEILEKYRKNPNDNFECYMYWTLINSITDKDELERLCWKGIEKYSRQYKGKPWPLAINKLALLSIDSGKANMKLLDEKVWKMERKGRTFHLFDYDYDPDTEIDDPLDPSRVMMVTNPRALLANKVVMYLMNEEYQLASRWAHILPEDDERMVSLKVISRCLSGKKITGDDYDYIREFSPRNKVVVDMIDAKEKEDFELLQGELMELPMNDPITHYLWAQVIGKYMFVNEDSEGLKEIMSQALYAAFVLDPKTIELAQEDFFIPEEVLNPVLASYQQRAQAKIIPREQLLKELTAELEGMFMSLESVGILDPDQCPIETIVYQYNQYVAQEPLDMNLYTFNPEENDYLFIK